MNSLVYWWRQLFIIKNTMMNGAMNSLYKALLNFSSYYSHKLIHATLAKKSTDLSKLVYISHITTVWEGFLVCQKANKHKKTKKSFWWTYVNIQQTVHFLTYWQCMFTGICNYGKSNQKYARGQTHKTPSHLPANWIKI